MRRLGEVVGPERAASPAKGWALQERDVPESFSGVSI